MTAIFLCSIATEVTKLVHAVLKSARASAGTRTLLQGTVLSESTQDCMAPGLLLSRFQQSSLSNPGLPRVGSATAVRPSLPPAYRDMAGELQFSSQRRAKASRKGQKACVASTQQLCCCRAEGATDTVNELAAVFQ